MESDFNKNYSKHCIDHSDTICLAECPIGQKCNVKRVNAGQHAKRRLACLGIVPGVEIIKKKAAPFRGPIEVIIKGSSLVIGRGLAAKIVVK